MIKNPLKQQSRYQAAPVISPNQELSLLDWLEVNDRLLALDLQAPDYLDEPEAEISDLLGPDDIESDVDDQEDDMDLED